MPSLHHDTRDPSQLSGRCSHAPRPRSALGRKIEGLTPPGSSHVAALLYAEPLVTFAAAMLLLGERVTGVVIVGGLLVLASGFIAQYAPAPERA